MKKRIALLMGMALTFSFAACGGNADSGQKNPDIAQTKESETDTENVLIAYFSVPEDVDTSGVDTVAGASIVAREEETLGNTEYVANIIQQTIGGDLFRIETVQQYPPGP